MLNLLKLVKEKIMPKKIKKALKDTVKRKGFSKKRARAYVYGTLSKLGFKPKKRKKKKK